MRGGLLSSPSAGCPISCSAPPVGSHSVARIRPKVSVRLAWSFQRRQPPRLCRPALRSLFTTSPVSPTIYYLVSSDGVALNSNDRSHSRRTLRTFTSIDLSRASDWASSLLFYLLRLLLLETRSCLLLDLDISLLPSTTIARQDIMATVAAMMASSVSGSFAVSTRSGSISTARIVSRPAFAFRRSVQIRCKADPESKSTPAENISSVSATPIVPPIPTPVAPKKKTPSFGDVFAFSGPGPETINGRLAMLGFVAALGAELATGQSLSTQLGEGGVSAFVFAAILFSTASLIPLFKGVSPQSKSKAFFSSDAEIWNGRAAMIGLVALAITEFVNGTPLV